MRLPETGKRKYELGGVETAEPVMPCTQFGILVGALHGLGDRLHEA